MLIGVVGFMGDLQKLNCFVVSSFRYQAQKIGLFCTKC